MATKKKTPTSSKKKSSASASSKKKAPSKKKAAAKKAPAKKVPAKKKAAVKKAPAKQKAATKKQAAAKKKVTAVKKAPAGKKTASKKKAANKKTAAKKKSAKKTTPPEPIRVSRKRIPASRARAQAAELPDEPVKPKVKPMNKRDLKKFKKILLDLRDRLQGDIQFLTTDNLHRAGRETGADLSGAAQHSADHGTDNFDREFALSLASAEQDVMYEVDEALMRIAEGTYGICELTGVQIEPARLEVIPYTRFSVQAQAKMEQSRAGYRPFGQSFRSW